MEIPLLKNIVTGRVFCGKTNGLQIWWSCDVTWSNIRKTRRFVLRSKCETLNNVDALHLNITQVSFYAYLVSSNRSNHIYPK